MKRCQKKGTNKMDWQTKKRQLLRKQEEFCSTGNGSDKKLKRSYINNQGKQIIDYDFWPADRVVLQRIATHMDAPISPSSIEKKLKQGEMITTKHGAVYSLVPINSHH